MTGRPHFAEIMVEKGYATSYRQAFDEYLDESAKDTSTGTKPQFAEAVARILTAGGLPRWRIRCA